MNIQEVENKLAYKFVRGSTLYNTNIETSDVDYGGVFILPNEKLIGLPNFYQDQVSDERHDATYYEFNRWVELLMKANPNATREEAETAVDAENKKAPYDMIAKKYSDEATANAEKRANQESTDRDKAIEAYMKANPNKTREEAEAQLSRKY